MTSNVDKDYLAKRQLKKGTAVGRRAARHFGGGLSAI